MGIRASILTPLIAIASLFALDSLLFRTNLYPSILEPDSSTGLFELILRREQKFQATHGDNIVLTVGDSRFAYSPKISNQYTPETGYIFRHGGVAGSNERTWYYMLRDLDPTARRYRAIVFGVAEYDDEDSGFNPAEDLRSLHYVIARLRWSDIPEFTSSFETPASRWSAFRGSTLKGTIFQNDILAFLSNPKKRLDYVALCNEGYEGWTYDYEETTNSMAGLQIDWNKWEATFPPNMNEDQKATVGALLHKPEPQTGRLGRYRSYWYQRILDRYRGSRTRIIFIRLPRGAVPRPDGLVPYKTHTVRDQASRAEVTLAPEHLFDRLERADWFRDGIHLNRTGIGEFSPMLAREITKILGGSPR